ncbi:hypothetical protein ACA910_013537 [Epithemia clementina (nom. ined.)]
MWLTQIRKFPFSMAAALALLVAASPTLTRAFAGVGVVVAKPKHLAGVAAKNHIARFPPSIPPSTATTMMMNDPSLMVDPALATAAAPVVPASTLWTLRATSAFLSYVGIVAFVDRPRGGKFQVNPETDIIVQPSSVPGAGLGLFCQRDLPQGTILGTYPGVLLPITDRNLVKLQRHPQCEAYIWRFSDSLYVLDPTNAVGELDPTCSGGSYAIPGSNFLFSTPLFRLLFGGGVPTTLCRINEPPPGCDVNVITDEDLDSRTITFVLERDVMMGEELFIDYGLTYNRAMYGTVSKEIKSERETAGLL